jgi:hypothetical protein
MRKWFWILLILAVLLLIMTLAKTPTDNFIKPHFEPKRSNPRASDARLPYTQGWWTTKRKCIGAFSEGMLQKSRSILMSGDTAVVQSLIDSGRIMLIEPGTQVWYEGYNESIERIRVRLKGSATSIWISNDVLF